MKILAFSEVGILQLQERRSAGEKLSVLAKELGMSWQKLWGILQPSVKPQATVKPRNGLSLVERYRPLYLQSLCGQDEVVKVLHGFSKAPTSLAFIFEGATGTGKTSAALALAEQLGCDLQQKDFGGVSSIASGEQTADTVRAVARRMTYFPMFGSGWKVLIVNEADRMGSPAETIWLDLLESLPNKTVVVFTTNDVGRLSQRFQDRCVCLAFESDAKKLAAPVKRYLAGIWFEETGRLRDPDTFTPLVDQVTVAGRLSFRRALQALSIKLLQERGN